MLLYHRIQLQALVQRFLARMLLVNLEGDGSGRGLVSEAANEGDRWFQPPSDPPMQATTQPFSDDDDTDVGEEAIF